MPVPGIIFLRHATNRYDDAVGQIEADQAAGKMAKRKLIQADFLIRRALMLPQAARYDHILKLPKGTHLGTALVQAMDAIEHSFVPLLGPLPKDYDKFESDILENILRIFDSETLRTATGEIFGRIYEYFLMKFAMQGAQDNGDFFTPPSLVQTIFSGRRKRRRPSASRTPSCARTAGGRGARCRRREGGEEGTQGAAPACGRGVDTRCRGGRGGRLFHAASRMAAPPLPGRLLPRCAGVVQSRHPHRNRRRRLEPHARPLRRRRCGGGG